jgi:uncharacterized damage-inducible protein DinB
VISGMNRIDPHETGDELTLLTQYLDYHRATLVQKVSGLDRQQLRATVGASELTLAGLVKHLALVEDTWFTVRLIGSPAPEPWASAPWDDDQDWEFHSAVDDEPADLLALYAAACDRSRAATTEVAASGGLDALSARTGGHGRGHINLRWILLHMLEETARHNGHADLIRESIDGVTGE